MHLAHSIETETAGQGAVSGGRGRITARACDLSDATAIQGMAGLLEHVDVLVLNTGGPPPEQRPASDPSRDDLDILQHVSAFHLHWNELVVDRALAVTGDF